MHWLSKPLRLWWKLVQFGFYLLYNQLAFTYDFVSVVVSLNEWRCWQRTSLKYINISSADETVLELAHGTGNLQIDLKNAGFKTLGLDLSPYMGHIAQVKLLENGKVPDLIRGEGQWLPFPSKVFPTVISTFPTPFIFETSTLNEIYRILKDDGILIVVPNGVLVGGGIVRQFLEFLYQITGQHGKESSASIPPTITDIFCAQGFELTLHHEVCRRSYAQVIIARKNPGNPVFM